MAPAPVQKLRPIVHCQTQKYSAKVRLGRGFTLEELSGAGLNPDYAQTVGIAVDKRRTNKSEESLALNIARLEEYKKKLVVFDKDAAPSDVPQLTGDVMPIVKPADELVMEDVTDEMKSFKAFTTMRVARKETKVAGQRVAVSLRKKKK